MRSRIGACLNRGELTDPDGRVHRWRACREGPSEPLECEGPLVRELSRLRRREVARSFAEKETPRLQEGGRGVAQVGGRSARTCAASYRITGWTCTGACIGMATAIGRASSRSPFESILSERARSLASSSAEPGTSSLR